MKTLSVILILITINIAHAQQRSFDVPVDIGYCFDFQCASRKHAIVHTLDITSDRSILLPGNFAKFKVLKRLALIRCGLKRFPKNLTSLTDLEKVTLAGNKISRIPRSINKMKNLVDLNLICNNLKDLPNEMSNLNKLESLNLYGNPFKQLPEVLFKIPNLKYLELSEGQFSDFELERLQNARPDLIIYITPIASRIR